MSEPTLNLGATLLVASRGSWQRNGLYRFARGPDGAWGGTQLAEVDQLAALVRHPSLSMVYGVSGIAEGVLHGWRVEGHGAVPVGRKPSEGGEPCDIAIDPDGRLLVVSNYPSSALAIQRLTEDGAFDGPVETIPLEGRGPDPDRQDAAHPHQAFFHQGRLVVIDLGADCVREFDYDPSKSGAAAFEPRRITAVPPGTGPRHAVVLPDGRLAISGELGSSLVLGAPGAPLEDWACVPGTERSGPARTRHRRNYPGDIKRSASGRHVYFANRGYDTISTFDVSGPTPVLVSETDSLTFWPQHLLVTEDHLLCAGWDSSEVVAMPLRQEVPGEPVPLLRCAGAGWLTLM